MSQPFFNPDLFAYLNDLSDHNDRGWFNANKARYEASVRQPALDFITEFAAPLSTISPHFVADSRTVGGSLFRIQRDTRFSKDKTPYKTNTGLHFRHERAKDAHAPGFYVHLEPRNCFVGAGLWAPEPKVCQQIRHHIDEHQDEWVEATSSPPFSELYTLDGDSLKRPPRGFEPDHPLVDDLKRKSFVGSGPLKQGDVTRADFSEMLTARFEAASTFVAFLCDALKVEF